MSPLSETEIKYDPSTYWLAPARNFRTSARLHLQHLLFQSTLGNLFQPEVEKAVAGLAHLTVADLGCGNGIWLNDVERDLQKTGISADLRGYDVNSINFPAAAYLPQSIQLLQLDVLTQPLPDEAIELFDVVHIRAFDSVVASSGTSPLLSTALSLLKPGGWLQWEETKADRFIVQSPSPEISTASCDTISSMLKAAGDAQGLSYEFIGELDQHLRNCGFEEIRMTSSKKHKQDFKGWTEDYLMVFEGLADHFPSESQSPEARMTKESWATLFQSAVRETERGVAIHQGEIVTVIGRKPL